MTNSWAQKNEQVNSRTVFAAYVEDDKPAGFLQYHRSNLLNSKALRGNGYVMQSRQYTVSS